MGALAEQAGGRTSAIAPPPDAAEFRAAIEQAFELAELDDAIGPAICAADPRLRFEFTDGSALNVWAGPDRRLRWSFEPVEWTPKLVLSMSPATANRYLQGRESLAIAIAHGQVKVRGSTRAALRSLPATRLLGEPYRRVVAGGSFPSLAL